MAIHQSLDRPFLEIRNIVHRYGEKTALRNVSLTAHKSEVLALLGPSGSGKSTLLAVIAGIVKPSQGKILLDGRNLLELPPEFRDLGMVFQDFALWPHMTVAQNVAFPLRARGYGLADIETRVANTLERVGLQGFQRRRPHELSGGQQQRVALARAVIAETQLLLLDEPLSALDPATRSSVRSELAEILRKLNLTTIIVTHDREEAFELADHIAVLVEGQIQQHSTPEEVYERPANLAVARFMGANVLPVNVLADGTAQLHKDNSWPLELPCANPQGPAYLAIVPEQVQVTDNHSGMKNVFPGHLVRTQYRGGEYRLQVRIGNLQTGPVIEARSKTALQKSRIFVQLPVEAIHMLQESPPGISATAELQPLTKAKLAKLQEEIA